MMLLRALAVLASLTASPAPAVPVPVAPATNTTIPALAVSTLLDPDHGEIFGVPFGADEDAITQSLGAPTGHIHLGEHRDALLYGRAQLLLLYDGKLDGIRLSNQEIDFDVAAWLPDNNHWELANGIAPQMSRVDVLSKVKPDPAVDNGTKWMLTYRAVQALVQLSFSREAAMSEQDDAGYHVDGVLLAHLENGTDHWSNPPMGGGTGLFPSRSKLMGFTIKRATPEGIQVGDVFPDSPAAKAGIVEGDVITAMDGESMAGMDMLGYVRKARGKDVHTLDLKDAQGARRSVQVNLVQGSNFGRGPAHVYDPVGIGPGGLTPDFPAASSPDAPPIKVSAQIGHPVLVIFTATWCGPCKQEAPQIKALHDQYAARGVQFFSVYCDGDPADKVYAFAKTEGVDWPINTDAKGWDNAAARAYGILGVPTHVVIGKDGRIRQVNVPAPALAAALDDALR